MAELLGGNSFRFLFRQDEGTIDRLTWWRGFAVLAIPLGLATLVWWAISGRAMAPMADNLPQANAGTAFTHGYLLVYAALILLVAICFYNLSAKRLRARSMATGLASLLPLAALLAGAMHWMAPLVGNALPVWTTTAMDVVVLAIAAWNIFEMGIRESQE